jgi:hypothetical protein
VHYHLDGYNLAHRLAYRLAEEEEDDGDMTPQELRHLLYGHLPGVIPQDAESLQVYWDVKVRDPGIPAHEYGAHWTVHNVPDADTAIIDAMYGSPDPGRQMAVSSDREVTGKSRQLGGRCMSAEDFLFPDDRGGSKGGRRRKRR